MTGMAKRTFQFITRSMFNILYKAMVRNGLEYEHALWQPYLMRYKKNEGLQRNATKMLHELKNAMKKG